MTSWIRWVSFLRREAIARVEAAMLEAAKKLEFETAAALRDEMFALKKRLNRELEALPVIDKGYPVS